MINSVLEFIYKISKISGWFYFPSYNPKEGALYKVVDYLHRLDEIGFRRSEQIEKIEGFINNIFSKCWHIDCMIKAVDLLLSSGNLKIISDHTISTIRTDNGYIAVLEKLISYTEHKSSWDEIDKFASKILSNCGIRCIGYAMEVFYKHGEFQSKIQPFQQQFAIAQTINDLVIYIDHQEKNNNFTFKSDYAIKLTESSSLEDKIFNSVALELETRINRKISPDENCIKEVKYYLHDIFYGNIATNYSFFGFFAALQSKILHCDISIELDKKYINNDLNSHYQNEEYSHEYTQDNYNSNVDNSEGYII